MNQEEMPLSGIIFTVVVIGGAILAMAGFYFVMKRRIEAQQLEIAEDSSNKPTASVTVSERNPLISSGKLDVRFEKYKNKQEANTDLDLWKKMLPRRDSAFTPSGKISDAGRNLLQKQGVPKGVTSGLLFGGLALVGAGVFIWFFRPFFAWVQSSGDSAIIIKFIVYMGGLFYFALTVALIVGVFIGPAYGSVAALAGQYQLAKCRNLPTAATIASISTAISVCILWAVIAFVLKMLALESINLGGLLLLFAIALGASVWVAFRESAKTIKAAKFCEKCESYMTGRVVAHLGRETASRALSELAIAGSEFQAEPDRPVTVRRFQCEHCDEGYTELEVEFEGRWPKNPNEQLPMGLDALQGRGKVETMKANWLAFSSAMNRPNFETLTFTAPVAPPIPTEMKPSS